MKKTHFWGCGKINSVVLKTIGIMLVVFLLLPEAKATENFSNNEILWAIFKAEGGYSATYLFGIRSIKYKDFAEAKQICLNTIRNNRKRFLKQTKYTDYLEFLASRYCPINCDNDRGTNKFWLKNVRYFLGRG